MSVFGEERSSLVALDLADSEVSRGSNIILSFVTRDSRGQVVKSLDLPVRSKETAIASRGAVLLVGPLQND